MLMATIDASIMLIALPDIFKGIKLRSPHPGQQLLSALAHLELPRDHERVVVSLGRLGDMYGRVKMYNLGFAIYTVFSLLLAITWLSGPAAAWYLILMRVGQGVGAAFLMANSSAILTDAFPRTSGGWPSASIRSRPWRVRSSGWCWAGSSARSSGD